ncbi:hypothetical protein DRH13_02285 [Candidatus Woesebacteria bacterium]|nr:MAG: hypothetical protein DRH13_02285 [Candidatus Woesebacteria bacterium]
MVIQGMYGLGDNIYQRSVFREIKERVYLRTCWPQLYSDLPNILPAMPTTRLRTQVKNLQKQDASVWHSPPCLPSVKMAYSSGNLKSGSILHAMTKKIGVTPKIFDMPKFDGPKIYPPYVVIRPVTMRSEWYNRARGPEDVYICEAATLLRDYGYYVISVADIAEKEWCDKLPKCDLAYNHGELIFEKLMGLIQNASLVVGGVGWVVPACAASGTPLITILGGQGGHNSPEKIISKPMNDSKIKFIRPDNYCMCADNRHVCNKTISGFEEKFLDAMRTLI